MPSRRERSQCDVQPASVDFISLQHMSVASGGPPSWERSLPDSSTALAGFAYPLSAYPEPTYGPYFRPERSWDFPFQSFSPATGVATLIGLAGLSCWFHWPASELCPPLRAVPTMSWLNEHGSLDSPRVSSLRHPPCSPALHFWSAPLLHFCAGIDANARCSRVPLPPGPMIFCKTTEPL